MQRSGAAAQHVARAVAAFVESPHRVDDLDRTEVEHRLRVGVIAVRGGVPRHQHDVGDSERGRRQQIRLNGDSVSVPGRHLEDGLDSFVQQLPGCPDGRHAHPGVVGVGQVERVDEAGEAARGVEQRREIEALRRGELARDDEPSRPDEIRDSRHGGLFPVREVKFERAREAERHSVGIPGNSRVSPCPARPPSRPRPARARASSPAARTRWRVEEE